MSITAYSLSDADLPTDAEQLSTLVKLVIKRSGEEGVDSLLSKGVPLDLLLVYCASSNHVEVMDALIRRGANVNAKVMRPDGIMVSPLVEAADAGSYSAAKWLLEHGANIEATSGVHTSYTALWAACTGGFIRVVRLLLDHGAKVNTTKSDTKNSALFVAAQNGRLAICSLLLRAGADVSLANGAGHTPLLVAVAMVHFPVVALLRSAGASVHPLCHRLLAQMKQDGQTAVHGGIRRVTRKEVAELEKLLSNNGVETLLTVIGDFYRQVRSLERQGEYRSALHAIVLAENELEAKIGPPSVSSAMWTQIKMDEQRLLEAVYGVKGSDGCMSFWERQWFAEDDIQPPATVFYAWARHKNVIYRYGGCFFQNVEQIPTLAEMWAFDLDTRKWRKVPTSGNSPGPRAEGAAVVYKDSFYIFGGKAPTGGGNKLCRLDLMTFRWEVIKGKGLRPPQCLGSAMFVYKDTLYLHGGMTMSYSYCSDLWAYSFASDMWRHVSVGGTPRKDHCIWAAHGKIFVFGGEVPRPECPSPYDVKTIQEMEVFDLHTQKWSALRCAGVDPWMIEEFTILPLYRGQTEASTIIIWGGYAHPGHPNYDDAEAFSQQYGEEFREWLLPYRRRLLLFDTTTLTWTKLEPANKVDVMPSAQCIAAELSSAHGVTRILVGGGYGLTGLSETTNEDMIKPQIHRGVFDITILDEQNLCFADQAEKGSGWAWSFFDTPGKLRPSLEHHVTLGSPTLHQAINLSEEDFIPPSSEQVKEDDEAVALGRVVRLQGLKAKPRLNGAKGRCGYWQADKGRYQVFVPSWESGGPCFLSIKPANLRYSSFSGAELEQLASRPKLVLTPLIFATWPRVRGDKRSQLAVIESVSEASDAICSDKYRGPLSARANAVLQSVCEKQTDQELVLVCLPPDHDPPTSDSDIRRQRYLDFVRSSRARDRVRVKAFEQELLASRDESKWGDWLEIQISLDAIVPKVERTILVSPDITMDRLHHQVLCPAVGWAANTHAYAIRRVETSLVSPESPGDISFEEYERDFRNVALMRERECWIGPRRFCTLDTFFLPLYIGGDVADDRVICLGDLIDPEAGVARLQYVYDLGDWWSHSIYVSRASVPPPGGVTVAHLVSGSGACPPEDCGGPHRYYETIAKLTGDIFFNKSGLNNAQVLDRIEGSVDPSREPWWQLLNEEIRSKPNGAKLSSPIEFDLEKHRAAVAVALRRPLPEEGDELDTLRSIDTSTGLNRAESGPKSAFMTGVQKTAKATDACAVCGVTASLKNCAGCHAIAFCSREHQLAFWPKHKAACKAAQKKLKK